MLQQATREDADADMRRLQRVAAPRHRARPDSEEVIVPVLVGGAAAEAAEIGVDRLLLAVLGMGVFPGGVGLPDFQERVGHRRAVAIGDPAFDADLVALRLAAGGEIGPFGMIEAEFEDRAPPSAIPWE